MYLYQLLSEESIKIPIESTTKDDVLEEMVDLLCKSHNIPQSEAILKGIKEREKAMSTGIGNGIAIPHCKSSAVNELIAAFGISRAGIDFDSDDEKPAKIFFILIAQENNPGPHVKALAKLARVLGSAALRDELIKADTPAGLLNILRTSEENL